MPRLTTLSLVASATMLVAACSTVAAAPSTAPTTEPATPTVTITATGSPIPTGTQTPAPSPTPVAILPGEAWLLHDRYVAQDVKGVFLVRPDGSDDHRILTDVQADLRAGTWSPDGSHIAFVSWHADGAQDGEIWTAAADGSGAAKLLDGSPTCSGAFYPAWAPDGKALAFVCYTADGDGRLATYDIATKRIRDLYQYKAPQHLDNPPRWSPDGSTIAFDILHWDPTLAFIDGSLIATVPADGGEVRRLTDFESFGAFPDWRPDGRRIVFNTYDQGNMNRTEHASNLYEIDPDGSGMQQLTTASVDGSYRLTQPRWDPAGDRIWVTVWKPDEGIGIGWIDPVTGTVTELGIEGSRPQPRPAP